MGPGSNTTLVASGHSNALRLVFWLHCTEEEEGGREREREEGREEGRERGGREGEEREREREREGEKEGEGRGEGGGGGEGEVGHTLQVHHTYCAAT